MKVMVIVKANADSEAGRMPSEQELSEMGAFNEQLVAAGIMLAGEGLHATQRGRRIHFGAGHQGRGRSGPASEQIAGFWLWEVRSLDEAVEWASRAPFGEGGTLELRPLISAEDFGEAFTPNYSSRNSVCVHSWKADPIPLPTGHAPALTPEPHNGVLP